MCLPRFVAVAGILAGAVLGVRAQAPTPKENGAATKRQVRIAAAADLQPVMPALAAAYEKETGIKVLVNFGSSATLATQILNGAPVDLFLGADFTFPERIVAADMAETKSPIAYAKGTLVLWARKDSPFQPLHLEVLSDSRVKSVAIANELQAPYGRAAASALRYMKLYASVSPKFKVGENISQTAEFVESGNAELGLISLTAAESPHFKEMGSYVLLPPVSYPPIVQYGVVLKSASGRAEAHAFLAWMISPPVQSNLTRFGLRPVR